MTVEPAQEEAKLYNAVTALAQTLAKLSDGIEGLSTDPRMFSAMLFQRLWSNHRGFTVLWNEHRFLEADIILRSGIETAICIAANFRLRDDFVMLMRQDAAHTIAGQIKIRRREGDTEGVREAEAMLHMFRDQLPEGKKPAKLQWDSLADAGQWPHRNALCLPSSSNRWWQDHPCCAQYHRRKRKLAGKGLPSGSLAGANHNNSSPDSGSVWIGVQKEPG